MNPLPPQFTYLALTILSAIIFHGILWARNAPFLWKQRRVILKVILLGELWMLITDPIGGLWGAWFFDKPQTLGIYLLGVMPLEDFIGIAVTSSAAACAILVFGYSQKKWIW
jgi:lycopene cyclase domain-containing protein